MTITRAEIIAEARRWIAVRTPYQHQACKIGVGADCIGFIGGVALACGIPGAAEWHASPEFRNYSRDPDPRTLYRACYQFLLPIEINAARLADIYVMMIPPMEDPRGKYPPRHFSMISQEEPRYIIHSYAQARKVTEHRLDDVWTKRIVAAFRFRGVA
jgi:NlpC/P60 family putative phage cell wall peptidase